MALDKKSVDQDRCEFILHIHGSLGTMNIYKTFHGNPSSICGNISVRTKVVDHWQKAASMAEDQVISVQQSVNYKIIWSMSLQKKYCKLYHHLKAAVITSTLLVLVKTSAVFKTASQDNSGRKTCSRTIMTKTETHFPPPVTAVTLFITRSSIHQQQWLFQTGRQTKQTN